jgi:hypothetical protein
VLIDDSIVRGHHQRQDRADDARCWRAGGAHAHRFAADPAQLLLRRRHAGAGQAARGPDGCGGDDKYINADSLAFISIDGLYRALGDQRDPAAPQRCDACFSPLTRRD